MCRKNNNMKRIKRLMASAMCISLITFAFEKSVKGYATFYAISEQQERSNWCWVASARGVARGETTVTATQSAAVRHVKGSVVNEKGTPDETEQAAEYFSPSSDFVQYGGPLAFNQIKACIDNGHLVMTLFFPNESSLATSGHAIFVIGYDDDYNGDGEKVIRYCETSDGTTKWYLFDLFNTLALTPVSAYEYTDSIFCRLK